MSSRYLVMTANATIALDGTAVVDVSPSVGEYWAVAAVRVSQTTQPQFQSANTFTAFNYTTVSTSSIYPYCALYAGAVGVIDPTTFLDDTTLGSGDTSSVISGTITAYGDAITARWKNGNIGNNVFLTVYGRSYDNLPELQEQLAPVPGVRFSGTTANTAVWTFGEITNNTGGSWSSPPTFTTPLNANVEIVSLHYRTSTDATVATRQLGVRFTDPSGIDLGRYFVPGTQGASGSNVHYSFAQGIVSVSGGTLAFQTAPLPSRMALQPGSSIVGIGINLQAGDTWSQFALTYRQYITLTNMSYT